jgi:hypothetical protein
MNYSYDIAVCGLETASTCFSRILTKPSLTTSIGPVVYIVLNEMSAAANGNRLLA